MKTIVLALLIGLCSCAGQTPAQVAATVGVDVIVSAPCVQALVAAGQASTATGSNAQKAVATLGAVNVTALGSACSAAETQVLGSAKAGSTVAAQ